jgi:hypothetical protein
MSAFFRSNRGNFKPHRAPVAPPHAAQGGRKSLRGDRGVWENLAQTEFCSTF